MASHDQLRLLNLIKAHNVNPVRFVGGGVAAIDPASRAALDAFAKGVNETERPGSVPVPLVVNGKENRRERRKRNDDSAQNRASLGSPRRDHRRRDQTGGVEDHVASTGAP